MSTTAVPEPDGCVYASRIPDGCFASEEIVFPDDVAEHPLVQMFCATVDALSAQEAGARAQVRVAVRRMWRQRRRFVSAYARR